MASTATASANLEREPLVFVLLKQPIGPCTDSMASYVERRRIEVALRVPLRRATHFGGKTRSVLWSSACFGTHGLVSECFLDVPA